MIHFSKSLLTFFCSWSVLFHLRIVDQIALNRKLERIGLIFPTLACFSQVGHNYCTSHLEIPNLTWENRERNRNRILFNYSRPITKETSNLDLFSSIFLVDTTLPSSVRFWFWKTDGIISDPKNPFPYLAQFIQLNLTQPLSFRFPLMYFVFLWVLSTRPGPIAHHIKPALHVAIVLAGGF